MRSQKILLDTPYAFPLFFRVERDILFKFKCDVLFYIVFSATTEHIEYIWIASKSGFAMSRLFDID